MIFINHRPTLTGRPVFFMRWGGLQTVKQSVVT